MREQVPHICLTVWSPYGTKYSCDDYTRDVDSALTCSRDLWRIAAGDVRTDASPLKQLSVRLQGLSRSGSLFLCVA